MGHVTLTSLRKYFGAIEAIKGVSLDIAKGEFVVFVGPSGCGKSTLLRMIAGLEDVDEGSIAIAGRDVTDTAPALRGVAMVFQSYALYPHMNVYDNMAYGLRRAGLAKGEVDSRVRAAARMLQIEGLLDRKPRAMSGGQRQRVAIGRAIVREPEVFLFDEPLSNLDAALRVETRSQIARLHRDLNATMIFVTHDQVEAMTLADRIVVLNGGRVEQVGTPREVYHRPANTFVAGFIGSPPMNLFPVAGLGLDTPAGAVTLGLRPEKLRLVAPGAGLTDARVTLTEHLGGETILHLADGDRALTLRAQGDLGAALDERVGLAADLSGAVWFDAEGRLIG